MKPVKILFLFLFFVSLPQLHAQVTIGKLAEPDSNAVLELDGQMKMGLLLPRIPLTSTTSPDPMTKNVEGMFVYNTATADDVTPGIYYNDGSKWVRIDTNITTQIIDNTTVVNISSLTLGMPLTCTEDAVYDALGTDYVIVADGSSNQIINLPDAVGNKGKVYLIVDLENGGSSRVAIQTNNGDHIKFLTSSKLTTTNLFTLHANSQVSATFQSDGKDWIIIRTTSQISSPY